MIKELSQAIRQKKIQRRALGGFEKTNQRQIAHDLTARQLLDESHQFTQAFVRAALKPALREEIETIVIAGESFRWSRVFLK